MRRLLATFAVLAVLALLAGTLSPALTRAQDGTPIPDQAGAVTIVGSDGQPEGTVEVTALQDPFKDFDPSSAPQRGFHYVMAAVTITNTGSRDLEVNAYGFSLVDADGFVYQPAFVYRTQASTDATPDLPSDPVPAGGSASGAVFFQALDNTEPALVLYQPSSYDRLITVADLRDQPVQQGDAVDVLASDGTPAGTVSVDDLVQPLKDFDPSSAPQRGFEYVGVVVTVTNGGSSAITVDPSSFNLIDADGFVYTATSIYRTADAETQQPSLQYGTSVEPGASVTGLVGFQVLTGTKPGVIYYAPSSDRHVRVAEYGAGQAPKPSGTPAPAATTKPSLGRQGTPSAGTSADCTGALEWGQATQKIIGAWADSLGGIGDVFSGGTPDPAAIRKVADASRDAADQQRALDVPAIAEDANAKLVELFDESANALDDLADAAESGDQAAIGTASSNVAELITQASTELDTLLQDMVSVCPELDILNG